MKGDCTPMKLPQTGRYQYGSILSTSLAGDLPQIRDDLILRRRLPHGDLSQPIKQQPTRRVPP
jgi:hypothetical protein